MQVQNKSIQPLLTDVCQILTAYAYWKTGKLSDRATFELIFYKSPFNGEFTIFAGLEECLNFLKRFRYSQSDIEYLKEILPPNVEDEFFIFLSNINASDLTLYSVKEGSVVFPRVPLMKIEGPLIIAQLLETTFLNLINYASLMATNAARYRINAENIDLLEMGLRRAQGPDGGLSASKYAYIGGFDTTSNVLAGKLFNIPVKGTQGHSYISCFSGFSDLKSSTLKSMFRDVPGDLLDLALMWRTKLARVFRIISNQISDGELAAFVSYAIAFPHEFVILVDTYDVIKSGLINFCATALALNDLGYKPVGIRIDSGDLAYLSKISREYFNKISDMYNMPWFNNIKIIASNDINEEAVISLNQEVYKIDCFGIGTHLVTCQKQPAFSCIYKLVELNNQPRIKLTHDLDKIIFPGKKEVYRIYGEDGYALLDLIQTFQEDPPKIGKKILCRHPFMAAKRAYVISHKIEKLYSVYWQNATICQSIPSIQETRLYALESMKTIRNNVKRKLNPAQYKVSVSDKMYNYLHNLWLEKAPIDELW